MYTQPVALIIPNGVKQNGADCFEIIDPDSGGAATVSVALRTKGATGADLTAIEAFVADRTGVTL
jgi:hypothetical protein